MDGELKIIELEDVDQLLIKSMTKCLYLIQTYSLPVNMF